MDFQEFKKLVMQEAQDCGLTDYELYYRTEESMSVSAFQGEVNDFTSSVDGGVCFRCLWNEKAGYASTEELSAEQAASIVRRARDNASVIESKETETFTEGGLPYEKTGKACSSLPSAETLTHLVLDAQAAVRAADEMVTDRCETQGFCGKTGIAICNSHGLDLSYENAVTGLLINAVVSDGKEMTDDFELKVGAPDQILVEELAKKAAANAKAKLGADVALTGNYPVVFAPGAMCSLLRTFSCVFSAERAQKGLSLLNGKEGSRIASELVTLVDDPFSADSPMPMPFDAEGTPTCRKEVIAHGTLNTLLHNRKTALAAGKETTGNASKASYSAEISIDPFTFCLAAGELSEEELLCKAGNGVYITELEGLHAGANVISGDFSLQSSGFQIENGKKTSAVRSFTVAGNFYDLLKQITGVASNMELPMAMGITSFGSPSVLVEGLTVAGK